MVKSILLSIVSVILSSQAMFGVNAEVYEIKPNMHEVRTYGIKDEEGVVFTLERECINDIDITMFLKGNIVISIKVDETDSHGKFIKSSIVKVKLTDQWQPFHINPSLHHNTKYVDILILSENKSSVVFYVKDVNVLFQKKYW